MPEPARPLPVALLVAVATLASCSGPPRELVEAAQYRNWRLQQASRPTPERDIERDPETGERTVDRSFIALGGGTRVNHGVHRTWYPDGQPATLRSFDDGEPVGVWWTWWKGSGLLRSAYDFDATRATRMAWWHANGLPASEGPAIAGRREGRWRFWHEGGRLAGEGEFVGGRRDGPWVFYDESGEWTERGTYRAGVRVGPWEFRDAPGL